MVGQSRKRSTDNRFNCGEATNLSRGPGALKLIVFLDSQKGADEISYQYLFMWKIASTFCFCA